MLTLSKIDHVSQDHRATLHLHMVRHNLNFVGWKQRKEVPGDLRFIYSAATEDDALLKLTEFEAK